MHMVGADFHLVYCDVVDFADLAEYLLDPRRERPFEDALPILRRPDEVVGRVVGGVRGASPDHPRILATPLSSRAGIEPAPKLAHPSPPQAVGH